MTSKYIVKREIWGKKFTFTVNEKKRIVHGLLVDGQTTYKARVRASVQDEWDPVIGISVCQMRLMSMVEPVRYTMGIDFSTDRLSHIALMVYGAYGVKTPENVITTPAPGHGWRKVKEEMRRKRDDN